MTNFTDTTSDIYRLRVIEERMLYMKAKIKEYHQEKKEIVKRLKKQKVRLK